MEKEELPDCCKKDNGVAKGIFYGLIPHVGCIIFVLASILGSTLFMQFFKPLLMNKNIFYYLIAISLGFAIFSSFLYLKKNKMLSLEGIKKKKGYLAMMFGLTIGINLVLFLFVFPLLANTGYVSAETGDLSLLKISVAIPCSGHASLITSELKTIDGVNSTKFSLPNNFDVYYDSSKTSKNEILSLDVFEEYRAKVLEG